MLLPNFQTFFYVERSRLESFNTLGVKLRIKKRTNGEKRMFNCLYIELFVHYDYKAKNISRNQNRTKPT